MRFDVVVACAVGLEDLVTEELGELGHEAEPVKPANLLVRDVDSEGVVSLNYLTRQATRVFLMAWVGEAASPEDIRACSAEVDYTQYMAADQTFGVKGVRVGEHDFTSTDIGAYVGAAVVDCFQARHGVRVRANLDAPDVQFYAELRDSHFMITVNTTGDSLIRRHRRPYQHFAPMRPNLAATLLRMSSFDKGVSTLDPMAGGGTISTEACMMARDMPAGYFRDKWAFERLRCIDDGVFAQVRDRALSSIVPSETKIGACDKYLRSVEGMRGNLTAQGLADDIHTWEDMAETLAGVEVGEYDTLVTNPPYGVRIGNPRVVRRLYDAFPKAAMDKGIREIVVTTPRQANICNALTEAGYEVVEQRQFLYGGLWSWIVRAVAPGTAASGVHREYGGTGAGYATALDRICSHPRRIRLDATFSETPSRSPTSTREHPSTAHRTSATPQSPGSRATADRSASHARSHERPYCQAQTSQTPTCSTISRVPCGVSFCLPNWRARVCARLIAIRAIHPENRAGSSSVPRLSWARRNVSWISSSTSRWSRSFRCSTDATSGV